MKYVPIFFVILLGCGHKPKPQNRVKAMNMDTARYAKFPYIAKENNIQKLVGRMDSSDCAYFGRIGFAGEENEVYDCYQRLLEIAPDSFWVRLSYNKNPILRIYAFSALDEKKSPQLKSVKARLHGDKATFCYISADNRMIFSVSSFVSTGK